MSAVAPRSVGRRRLGIVGPTAVGKSQVALRVARRLGDVEIVTVDSMQVYRGMDIGTAKPTPAERTLVPHHLLDLVDPDDAFSVRAFQQAALDAIAGIETRGNRPMLVGGTGLYLRAVVDELDIPGQHPEVRASLEAEPDTVALHARLVQLDPLAASRMEPTNRRRVVRALEVTLGEGRPFSSFGDGLASHPGRDWDVVALNLDRDVLADRIAARYRAQLDAGFLAEVAALAARPGGLGRTAAQALGYRQLLDHLAGRSSLEDALDAAVAATRRFARRQRSWFRRDPRLEWMDATDLDDVAARLIARWENPDGDPAGVVRD